MLNGPQVRIRLRATVISPSLEVACESLDFERVRCGEARIVTVQLYNPQPVHCEWSVVYERNLAAENKFKKARLFLRTDRSIGT